MADRRDEMRTLPAILLAALVALVIIASAVLTTQFGMRDWPTPPMPDTATRLVTPTEAAGRATEKVTRHKQDTDDETGPTAYSGGGSRAPKVRQGDRRPTGERRAGRTRRSASSAGERPQTPAPSIGTESEQTDEGTDAAPAPVPAAPAPVTDGPPVVDGPGQDAQARPQDEPVEPAPVEPIAPDAGGDDDADTSGDDEPGQRHGPIRNAVENLLATP
jgi:hypothetical protein